MNNHTTNEQWLPVIGYEGVYQVSNWGRLASHYYGEWRLINLAPDTKGYLTFGMTKDKQRTTFRIHRVVAQVFLGECPKGYQVNHIDGDKANNHIANLEYVTNAQNRRHAVENGLHSHGAKHHMTKLNEAQVLEIAHALKTGKQTMTAIAKIHGTTLSNVNHINMGASWLRLLKGYTFPIRSK